MYRFVILHHQSPTQDHWDVMLESDSALTTWSIPPQCPSGASFTCPAVRLPDHRKHYLDYEGEVTGHRGKVFRVDAGTYEPSPPETFMLHGTRFTGTLTLENDVMTFESQWSTDGGFATIYSMDCKPHLLVISGPSGVGKGTLLQRVFTESGLPLKMSVSATTRLPRPGEVDGKEYHFLSLAEFESKRLAGEFLECFEVFGTGTWYGTLRKTVEEGLAAGHWVVLEIDVQGAKQVKEHFPEAMTFFIEPKSIDVLKERLQGRGTESEEVMQRRLATALEELQHVGAFEYRIVNDDLDTAVREFITILCGEREG